MRVFTFLICGAFVFSNGARATILNSGGADIASAGKPVPPPVAAPAAAPTAATPAGTTAPGTANTAGNLGGGEATVGEKNIQNSSTNCSCIATAATCAAGYFDNCAVLALNVASVGLAVVGIVMANKTEKAVRSGSSGAGGSSNIGANTSANNAALAEYCGSANASKYACDPAAVADLQKSADLYNSLLDQGKVDVPAGETAESMKAKLAKGMSNLSQLASGNADAVVSEFGDSTAVGGGAGGDGMRHLAGAEGAAASFSGGDGDGEDGGGLDGLGTIGKKASPSDIAGLGKVLWNGSLDQIDEASGKSLTLWQRATRRYQGEKGTRAFTMARVEFLRHQALSRQNANLRAPASTGAALVMPIANKASHQLPRAAASARKKNSRARKASPKSSPALRRAL